ncbi:MAG: thioredoxin-disulfide reductase [Lachnospiraceae bacterium]|nr:thioredoxin-disulfide reductase [Lachnospiraceae bacterium]
MKKDIVIIGGGPAGLSAAIYSARAGFDTLLIERNGMGGGQVLNTYEVDNYPGLPGISGFELGNKMEEHAKKLGVQFAACEVEAVEDLGKVKKLTTSDGEIEAKGIVIATGAQHAKLNVKGENELSGMGVSYCATCDGAFFKNRTVAVVGGGDVAVEDAIFLARGCEKVYLIHRRDQLRAAKSLQNALSALPNVEMCWDSVVTEIEGQDQVEGVRLRNVKTQEEKSLPVDGVFVAVGMLPDSNAFRDLVELDEKGYIVADETCRTSVPGIVAAGDIRTKQLRQIITAAADGANAVTTLENYFLCP